MEMGQVHVVQLGLTFRQEMLDITGISNIRAEGLGGFPLDVLRHSRYFPGIDEHRGPVGKNVEDTFSPAGIDCMNIQIPFSPSRERLSDFVILRRPSLR